MFCVDQKFRLFCVTVQERSSPTDPSPTELGRLGKSKSPSSPLKKKVGSTDPQVDLSGNRVVGTRFLYETKRQRRAIKDRRRETGVGGTKDGESHICTLGFSYPVFPPSFI